MASFSLVPTPSVAATNMGSLYCVALKSKMPPKPPILPSAPALEVERVNGFINSTSVFPISISTPDSLYDNFGGCCSFFMISSIAIETKIKLLE